MPLEVQSSSGEARVSPVTRPSAEEGGGTEWLFMKCKCFGYGAGQEISRRPQKAPRLSPQPPLLPAHQFCGTGNAEWYRGGQPPASPQKHSPMCQGFLIDIMPPACTSISTGPGCMKIGLLCMDSQHPSLLWLQEEDTSHSGHSPVLTARIGATPLLF